MALIKKGEMVEDAFTDVSTAELDYLLAALPAPDGRELVVMCPDGTSQTLSMSGPADTVTAAKALLVALMGCALLLCSRAIRVVGHAREPHLLMGQQH